MRASGHGLSGKIRKLKKPQIFKWGNKYLGWVVRFDGQFAAGLTVGVCLTSLGYVTLDKFAWYQHLDATVISSAATSLAAIAAAYSAYQSKEAGKRSERSELRSEAAQLRGQIDHERAKMIQKAQRASKLYEHLRRLHDQDRKFSSARVEHMTALDRLAGDASAYNGLSANYGYLRERTFESQDDTSFAKLQDDLLGLNLKTKDIDLRHYRHRVEMPTMGQFSGYEIPFEMDALKVL